jgi:hypothetical protein
LPNIATNAASSEIRRLAYRRPVADDNLVRWRFLNRWNDGGLTRDSRLVEGEEDRAEEGCRLLGRVRSEVLMDVDDKGRADGREQARL